MESKLGDNLVGMSFSLYKHKLLSSPSEKGPHSVILRKYSLSSYSVKSMKHSPVISCCWEALPWSNEDLGQILAGCIILLGGLQSTCDSQILFQMKMGMSSGHFLLGPTAGGE
jgi:hypothetical protein